MAYTKGIDVSHWQGRMDWNKAKSAGVVWAYARAAIGDYRLDPESRRNQLGMQEAGIYRGGYCVFLPDMDPLKVVDLYLAGIRWEPRLKMLPHIKDIEAWRDNPLTKWEPGIWREMYMRVYDELDRRTQGERQGIYSNKPSMDYIFGNDIIMQSEMYIHAQYTTSPEPNLPRSVTRWDAWQYSADGNKQGYKHGAQSPNLDMDRFNGSEYDMIKKYDLISHPRLTHKDKIKFWMQSRSRRRTI